MKDIIKSGILAITLLGSLFLAAHVLEDEVDGNVEIGQEKVELKTEENIHMPLKSV